ncbi:glycosyl hydrolase family 28-related protein [Priestia flexa]|uniref:glycosyl hydrolase family 28-related protein n=1 Tax=Priestia flexa TaxID=86664 RepID=UPI0010FC28A3|nr:glycosyl hydrolase family 28-related protein [Priestia flexa]QCS52389.1 hypothetical protein FED53_06990 [Priestia flexa]
MPRFPYNPFDSTTGFGRKFIQWINSVFNDVGSDLQENKSRVDNLIRNTPQPSETVDIRVDNDGVEFPTARDRINNDYNKNKQSVTELKTIVRDIVVNIKDFGGREDLPDNAFALQSAIDYLANQNFGTYKGGTVYVPPGTFNVKGKNITISLKSNVNIKGAGKELSKLKIADNTGDWGYLLIANGYLLENVSIKDLCLDCNRNNVVTKTERWQYSNRVLLNVGEAKNFSLHDCKLISNGIWGFRGFVENGDLFNNDFEFYPPTYTNASFDLSTIWIGGKNNRVANNRLTGFWVSNFIPETAIETQGHYTHCINNTIKGYKVGIIESNNTGQQNPLNPIQGNGALYNKIQGNTIEVLVGGITLWVMHVSSDSVLKACMINSNNIKVLDGNNISSRYRYGIGVFKANLATGATHDGVQLGKINTPIMANNHIEFQTRKVEDSLYFADCGIRLDSEFEIEGAAISGNTLYNIGGMGIYLSASVDSALNPNNQIIKNTVIVNNTFLEVRKPIRVNTRVKRTTITGNTFIQQIEYSNLQDNMLITIEAYSRSAQDTEGFIIKNNPIQSSIMYHRPFYPKYLLGIAMSNYSPDYQDYLEENSLGRVIVQGQTDRYSIVQSGNFMIGKDGLRYGLTNTIQATLGKPYSAEGGTVTVKEVIDSKTLRLSDALDIHPSQSVSIKLNDGSYKVATVVGVYKNYIFFTVDVSSSKVNEVINYYSDNIGLVPNS